MQLSVLSYLNFLILNTDDFCFAVTSVRSPRQVVGALNAEGPDIDIILSEVDLPMAKGLKLLKYITRDKDLRRIPVISKLGFIYLLCTFPLDI